MSSLTRRIALLFGLGGLLTLMSCGRSPTQPNESVTTKIEKINDYKRFDTDDVPYTSDVAGRFVGLQGAFHLKIRPDTLSVHGTPYFLGASVTEAERKIIETSRPSPTGKGDSTTRQYVDIPFDDLQRKLNQTASGVSDREFLPFGMFHLGHQAGYRRDFPNTPHTQDVDKRLRAINQVPRNIGDIAFTPIYLVGRSGGIVKNNDGFPIIDGIEIIPIRTGAGYSGMTYLAEYIVTGDENLLNFPLLSNIFPAGK